MANIEEVGFRAVIKDFTQHIFRSKQLVGASNAIEKAHQRLAVVSQQSAAAQRRALESVQAAQLRQAAITDSTTRRIALAQRNVQLAQERVAAVATKSAAIQEAADRRLEAAEIRLSNVTAAARRQSQAALFSTQRALNREADVAAANAVKLAAAQAAVASAGGIVAGKHVLVTTALKAVTAASVVYRGALTSLGKVLIAVTGFSNRFAVSLRFGLAALTAFTTAFVIGQTSQFESTLAKIDVLTGATRQETDRLGESIRELAKTVPVSPNELGAAAYFILSSGVRDVKEAMDILTLSAKASVAGLGATSEVAKVITAVINTYGKENISAAEATDILIAAVREGRAEATDFATQIGDVIPTARALGIQFDQVAASMAVLTNGGLSAAESATGLRGIMNSILDPASESIKLFKELGIPLEELRKTLREDGLVAFFEKLATASDKNIQAFAKFFPNIRAANAALSAFVVQEGKVSEVLERIRSSAGITQTAFDRMSETFSFQANLLRNQLSLALISIGSEVLPALTNSLKDTIKWIEANKKGIAEFARTVAGFASSVGRGVIVTLSAINSLLSWLPNNYGAVVLAVLAIGAAMAIAFGPQSAAVVGLAALVGGFSKLTDKGIKLPLGLGTIGGDKSVQFEGRDLLEKSISQLKVGKEFTDDIANAIGKGLEKGFSIQQAINQSGLQQLQAPGFGGTAALRLINILKQQGIDVLKGASELKGPGGEVLTPEQQAQIMLEKLEAQFNDFSIAGLDAGETLSQLEDGIITMAEAAELGISAIEAGRQEAFAFIKAEQNAAAESAFNYTKALSAVTTAFNVSIVAAQKYVTALAKEALAKAQAAGDAIFGRPTKEVAALELSLAELQAKRAEAAVQIVPQIEALQAQLDSIKSRGRGRKGKEAVPSDQVVAEVLEEGLVQTVGEAGEAFASAVAGQEEAIQAQIDALNGQLEVYDQQIGAIQRNIEVYTTQTEILEKQVQAADATLLTQEEQRKKALEVIAAVAEQSKVVRDLTAAVGGELIPEMTAMRDAVKIAQDGFLALSDESLRKQFEPAIVASTAAVTKHAEEVVKATIDIAEAMADFKKIVETNRPPGAAPSPFAPLEPRFQAHGGLTTRPTLTILGEGSKPELTLPLSDAARSRELLGSLPASTLAQIAPRGSQGPSSMFGDMIFNGADLETMRMAAKSEIDRKFNQVRSNYRRAGF